MAEVLEARWLSDEQARWLSDEQARWLSDEQQRIWRAWLLGSARIDAYLDADLRQFKLDLGEYEILVALSEADGWSLRMADLADQVHQSRSRLTHAVSRMERRGMVTRSPAPDDRRGVCAVLTDEGYATLVKAAPCHVEAVRRILLDAVRPEDFAALGRAMEAVLAVAD